MFKNIANIKLMCYYIIVGDYMYTTYFIIPKAVYFYCILPALLLILGTLIFMIVYRRKKGTYYYVYTMNFVLNFVSMLLCILLLTLLIGYSWAMLYIIYLKLIVNVNVFVIVILILLPIIPLVTLIIVCRRFIKNLKYKEELDENAENSIEAMNQEYANPIPAIPEENVVQPTEAEAILQKKEKV